MTTQLDPTNPADNPLLEWVARYQYDPELFAREVLDFVPDESLDPSASQGQADILRAYGERLRALRDEPDNLELIRQIGIVSGHGIGKTTALAICIIHHACVFFPQRVVCTSATEKQLYDALASEIKAWMKKLPPSILALFDIKVERIELLAAPEESYISFRTSSKENTEALAGIHSEHVLLVGDEASGIPDQVFEAAAGSMSGREAITILTGNPVRPLGFFYDVFNHPTVKERWIRVEVDCRYSPRVSPTWVREMAEKYGEDSNAFRVRVLGRFPLSDDETFIGRGLVEDAVAREVAEVPSPVRVWGLDCARLGKDKTTLCKRHGNVVVERIKTWAQLDTMQVVGRVHHEYDSCPPHERPDEILVDAIGIGAGVADRLRELGLPARGINVSEAASTRDRYLNLRSELWDMARDWLLKRDCKLPDDREFVDELCAVKADFTSGGKLQIEGKKEMRRRGMHSPDRADAFVLTFATTASAGLHGRAARRPALRRGLSLV